VKATAKVAGSAMINTADNNAKEHLMPTYMDVHDGFVGVTQEQFDEAHRRDLAIQAEEGVSYDHAWLDPESGKAFCLATGPSKEAVIRIHERAGHPASVVYEVPIAV
jgi:Nickel responsive protein SCO4226-like